MDQSIPLYTVQAFTPSGKRDTAAEATAFPDRYKPSSEPDAVKACLAANEQHSLGAWFGVVAAEVGS